LSRRADGDPREAISDEDGHERGTLESMRSAPIVFVALWLGAMGFFAFAVAPAAFTTLERDAAGRFVSVVFPRYYLTGILLGLLALAGLVARVMLRGGRKWDWLPLALVAIMLALTLYARVAVLPAAEAARAAMRQAGGGPGSAESLGFARLHRISGALNVVVMAAGVAFLAVEVIRRR
jgi:hypothetical protein